MATKTNESSKLKKLLQEGDYLKFPQLGELIKGTVISASRREVRLDIAGLTTGIIRGRELFNESDEYTNLQEGDEVEATVIDLENENGEMELSFRFAGQRKAWEDLELLYNNEGELDVKVLEANKGGLIVKVKHLTGFLPVSQLSPDHYPRVSGGDKEKILTKLKEYVGMTMTVQIIDLERAEEKIILSEKAVWERKQKDVIAQYNIGDKVEGEVTALADFGAFVKFDSLEGLVHISEIAWQRIDHPRDILKVGEKVDAEIIGIEGSKIFLSMKKLVRDPWKDVENRYAVGDVLEGTILKVNPFGFFVELDPEIHGLAHISELSDEPVKDIDSFADVGDVMEFKIVSIEPEEHRLGLSIKALNDEDQGEDKDEKDESGEDGDDSASEDEDASEEQPEEENTDEKEEKEEKEEKDAEDDKNKDKDEDESTQETKKEESDADDEADDDDSKTDEEASKEEESDDNDEGEE